MSNITVIKRSGKREQLTIEKWQAQVAKVCSGTSDVSQSMIEIKSQPHFYDGITTREIDEITLRAIVDLIDVESNPDTGHTSLPTSAKLRMPVSESAAVRQWGISFIVERETTQTTN